MDDAPMIGKLDRPTYGWRWLASPFLLLAVYFLLGPLDTTTEITPSHDTILNLCFALGGLSALLLMGVAVFGRQQMRVWQRIYLAFALALLGFLSVFLLSSRIAELTENRLDFPAASTRTYRMNLLIERAHRTQSKRLSSHIQTTPLWSNLDISENDYSFMLHHRRPGDDGHDVNEIASHGYFCAQVTVQQSGSALRVLHAGDQTLPRAPSSSAPGTAPLAERRRE